MESSNTPTAAGKAPAPAAPENATAPTPLAEVYRSAGAHMGEWFGCELPSDFGSPRDEQRFAHESVALIDKNYGAYFTFTGPDRVRYLNAVLTNDIKTWAWDTATFRCC